tara:strand:+ start:1399 stop:2571 length:1173 start_codon:yes stop_codon:yes gene_type:complete
MASELQVNTITEATSGSGITFAKDIIPATPLSHRNLIINGGMQVWQRATSAVTAAGYDTVDRWQFAESTGGTYTSEKDTLSVADQGTTGQRTSLKLAVTGTDTSLGASEYAYFFQRLEAQDLQHLQYGSSNAKTLTLSFWVKSNLTGTYCVYLRKLDNTAYFVIKEYTISAANTWEKKTITITPTEGSTSLITASAGAINNDNGIGLELGFSLAFGANYQTTKDTWQTAEDYTTSSAVNWMGASNNFYLTGVQLELGNVATPFEHRSYADELLRCSRYYHKFHSGADASGGAGNNDLYQNYLTIVWYSSSNARGLYHHPVPMRVNPSFSANGNFQTITGTDVSSSDFAHGDYGGTPLYSVRVAKSGTSGDANTIRSKNDATAYFAWDAEL